MCNCNDYPLGECPCAKNAAKELRAEQQGFQTLMDVIRLGRAGLPYKHLLKDLKRHAADNPELAKVMRDMTKNLPVTK